MQWKKNGSKKLWTGAWYVPKASRHDTKQSQGSRTRTTHGGFKSYMGHTRVQIEKLILVWVKYISSLKEQNEKSSNGL